MTALGSQRDAKGLMKGHGDTVQPIILDYPIDCEEAEAGAVVTQVMIDGFSVLV